MSPHARPLEIGLGMPTVEGYLAGGTARWNELAAFARRAEDLGFDSLWVPDHMLVPARLEEGPHGLWEAWSLLAALAAVTSRIKLGPLVACSGFRNPALLAKTADTIDEISGGRLILGLGAGYQDYEYAAFGYPSDHRISRFEEALQIVHGLLRRGFVDFEGHYYSARNCELRPRGPRAEGPPLLVGAIAAAPRMLRLTARYADLWTAWSVNRPADVPPLRAAVDAACVEVGRDPETLGRTIAVYVDLPGSSPGAEWVRTMRSLYAPPATGSPEELAELFRGFAREGISHAIAYPQPTGLAGVEGFAEVLELLDRAPVGRA